MAQVLTRRWHSIVSTWRDMSNNALKIKFPLTIIEFATFYLDATWTLIFLLNISSLHMSWEKWSVLGR